MPCAILSNSNTVALHFFCQSKVRVVKICRVQADSLNSHIHLFSFQEKLDIFFVLCGFVRVTNNGNVNVTVLPRGAASD